MSDAGVEGGPGTLYVCATPIGNLGDVSARLAQVLAAVDVVYAEDTRRTGRMLASLGVRARLESYFVGNEAARAAELGELLREGRQVALVTDAGTPAVSDPGLSAVRAAVAAGATVTVIPGPSAVTALLAASGLPADRFVFEGFLPRRGEERRRRLDEIGAERRTVVFFTTAGRLAADLADLAARSDPDRSVVVGRELTKLHEEIWRGTLGAAVAHWSETTTRGELTVGLAGAPPAVPSVDAALREIERRVAAGTSVRDAVAQVATETGISRRSLYQRTIARNAEA